MSRGLADQLNRRRIWISEVASMTLKTIEAAAMKLPAKSRGELAAALLSTLDREESIEAERSWVEEADRRYREFRAGKGRATPAKKAIAAARAALQS